MKFDIRITGLGLIASLGWSASASAFSPNVDASCVHVVPSGGERLVHGQRVPIGEVDVANNRATKNGKTLVQYDDTTCQTIGAPEGAMVPPSNKQPASTGNWYAYSQTWATAVHGRQNFNYMGSYWSVPAAVNYDPLDPAPIVYLFPALQNFTTIGSGSPTAIIQPILQWGYNGYEGGSFWSIASMAVVSATQKVYVYGGNNQVYPGDVIVGTMSQYASNPDAWEVDTWDETTGQSWVLDLYNIPNSWPKFNFAAMGVVEAYGANTNAHPPLGECDVMPASPPPDNSVGYAQFFLDTLDEAGPSWNSYTYVGGATLNWAAENNPLNLTPNCSWSAYPGFNESSTMNTIVEWYP